MKLNYSNYTIELDFPHSGHLELPTIDIDGEAILITFTHTEMIHDKDDDEIVYDVGKSRDKRTADDDSIRRKKKKRRNGKNKKSDGDEKLDNPCKRVDLTVDFDKIGWGSWVIFPKTYNAYQCVGSCSTQVDGDPNNHAIIQNMVRRVNRNRAPTPCCVPTKLSSLSMLYYERGVIVVKEHEEMVVRECGCR